MAKFIPYKISLSQLNNVPIIEGQMILTTDEKALYFDITSSNRVKIYDNISESLDFEIVQALPTSNIDENTIYLIENGETGGGGGGSGITYAISKSGSTITLTGSDGSTSSVTVNEMTATEVQAMIDAAITSALEASY